MRSNALLTSSCDTTGCRTCRVDGSRSTSIAWRRRSSAVSRVCHAGMKRSTVLAAIHVANDSFSHTSFHHSIVTRSPNHWCAISCAATDA